MDGTKNGERMIYQFIENLSRLIMEWAISKQSSYVNIVDEVQESYSYHLSKLKFPNR